MTQVKETIIKADAGEQNTAVASNVVRKPKLDKLGRAYATGKRKNSIARVWLKPGKGSIVVNNMEASKYLKRAISFVLINQPFEVTGTLGKYDVECVVRGGGLTGQAGAIRHGIAVALQNYDPNYRAALKKEKLLMRDPRVVERKKVGFKKARKGPTYKKR